MKPIEKEDEDALCSDIEETKVVLWNDDFNTFEWVIESLIDVCNHSLQQATQCSLIVHNNGKCVVKQGETPKMKRIKNKLQLRGLAVTIE